MSTDPPGPPVSTRRASQADFPAVLALARRSLGWTDDDAAFLEWKHVQNPFGASPMWVAESEGRVVGFRTFLRWELVHPDGATLRAVRAVDTATDPDFQGRGIFTRLTLEAIDELTAEGVDLVFNTPNEKSRPGYLKMGWREVGPPARGATSRELAIPLRDRDRADVGRPSSRPDGGGCRTAGRVGRPCGRRAPARFGTVSRAGLATRRTCAFLSWRYGNPALGYRWRWPVRRSTRAASCSDCAAAAEPSRR